jgi:hypothetical protein
VAKKKSAPTRDPNTDSGVGMDWATVFDTTAPTRIVMSPQARMAFMDISTPVDLFVVVWFG